MATAALDAPPGARANPCPPRFGPCNLDRSAAGPADRAARLERLHRPGYTPTLREIATRKVSLDSPPFVGTPERVADGLARTIAAIGGDGFAIRQGIWPGYVQPFVEQVIPLLQQRGGARTEYTGTTLREHLREF